MPPPDPMLSPDETWARKQMSPEERLYRAAEDVIHGGRVFGRRKAWRELRAAVDAVGEKRRHESVAEMVARDRAMSLRLSGYQPTTPLTGRPPRGHNPRVHDCCECAQWQEDYYGSEWGHCHSDLPGGRTLRKHGGCVNNFVEKWRDGNDD
ncbi:MAG: hypothetical protein WC565_07490 [Parcubacteria group bacterium]